MHTCIYMCMWLAHWVSPLYSVWEEFSPSAPWRLLRFNKPLSKQLMIHSELIMRRYERILLLVQYCMAIVLFNWKFSLLIDFVQNGDKKLEAWKYFNIDYFILLNFYCWFTQMKINSEKIYWMNIYVVGDFLVCGSLQ